MKKSFLAALDLALTAIFIGGGLLLLAEGAVQGLFAHNIVTGVVLAVIGAALAGTPLRRLSGGRGVPNDQRRLKRMLLWRIGVTPGITLPKDDASNVQTPYNND